MNSPIATSRLSEEQVLKAVQGQGLALTGRICLTHESGKDSVPAPTVVCMQFARAIEASLLSLGQPCAPSKETVNSARIVRGWATDLRSGKLQATEYLRNGYFANDMADLAQFLESLLPPGPPQLACPLSLAPDL